MKLKVYSVIMILSFIFVQCQENKVDEAFVTLDDKLTISENALKDKSQNTYGLFDQKMVIPETRKKVEPWFNRAFRIKSNSDGVSNFLVLQCSQMIKSVEGKDWHECDGAGVCKLLPLSKIKNKDNFEAPTVFFSAKGKGEQRGKELRNSIHKYRDSICFIMANYSNEDDDWSFTPTFNGESLVEFDLHATIINREKLNEALVFCNPKDTAKIANIYLGLSQPAFYENHNEIYSWEMTMFDHAPMVAAGAMFTAFIVDVRNSESAAVDFLYSKVAVPVFNFNNIEPLEFAPSNYKNKADSNTVAVMIAAFDTVEGGN